MAHYQRLRTKVPPTESSSLPLGKGSATEIQLLRQLHETLKDADCTKISKSDYA